MPVAVQIVNPEDTLEIGRQKINSNDDALQNQGNSLESQQAAHVAAGHPSLYYSKAEVDAAIAAAIGAAQGYKDLVAWIGQNGINAPTLQIFKNEIGGVPATSYVLVGRYLVTLPGLLTIGKTIAIVGANGRPAVAFGQPYNNDGNSILISTFDFNGNWADGVLTAPLTIRVYN